MGANKTKLPKTVVHQLSARTKRSTAEIKAMYTIFRRHFPNGKIESPEDLWRCLQKFSLQPMKYEERTAERLYRLFESPSRHQKIDGSIDFFNFMIVSHILEHGSAHNKIVLYFESLDVNNDGIISREDLEACLPHTVESQQLIQQLLRQWDMNRDGHVNLEDFEGYINSNPHLLPMFADERERVRLNSVSYDLAVDHPPSTHNYPITRDLFVTSK